MRVVESSGLKTSDAVIQAQPAYLAGFDVEPPLVGFTRVTFYDSRDSNTSGKKVLAEAFINAGSPGLSHDYAYVMPANEGIYADVTGNAVNYIVRYMVT